MSKGKSVYNEGNNAFYVIEWIFKAVVFDLGKGRFFFFFLGGGGGGGGGGRGRGGLITLQ